ESHHRGRHSRREDRHQRNGDWENRGLAARRDSPERQGVQRHRYSGSGHRRGGHLPGQLPDGGSEGRQRHEHRRQGMKLRLFAALFFTASTAMAAAPLSIEDLLAPPFPSQLTAAPSGGRVAWVANAEGARNIWIADSPDYQARQLTSYAGDSGIETGKLAFTPDGQSVVFTRGGDLDTGGENTNPTHEAETPEQAVWIVSVKES